MKLIYLPSLKTMLKIHLLSMLSFLLYSTVHPLHASSDPSDFGYDKVILRMQQEENWKRLEADEERARRKGLSIDKDTAWKLKNMRSGHSTFTILNIKDHAKDAIDREEAKDKLSLMNTFVELVLGSAVLLIIFIGGASILWQIWKGLRVSTHHR